MAPRCFIHIGAPKTGTTFIQRALFENRDILATHGILYPNVNLRGYGHHDLAYLLSGGYPDYATPQPRSLDELANDLRADVANQRDSILLSSENFYLFPRPRPLHDLLAATGCLEGGRRAEVIVYVRRQEAAHESWYNQTIKAHGRTHDLPMCIRETQDLWDYDKRLAEWSATFGHEALIVRPYETDQFTGGSLLYDFCNIIGVPADVLTVTAGRVNSGLNADLLEFARILNKLPMDIPGKRRFHRELIDLSERSTGSGLFDEAPAMDAATRDALRDHYAAGNRRLAQTYLGRDALFLEPPPPDRASNSGQSALTTEKLALIVGWLLMRER